jgi:multiple sugar transport system substrate-binding protein
MTLRGMTWDHPRGYGPLRAFAATGRTEVVVEWDAQPLADFESRPLRELAARYDLLVIDHPGLGAALADHALLPLDEVFAPADLATWESAAAGPTWPSYAVDGRQWALPIDAATQVGVYRPDVLDRPPSRWSQVAQIVRRTPSALCLGGPHALLTLLACGAPGAGFVPEERGSAVLTLLRELWTRVDRDVSLRDPIAVHEAMAAGAIAYCPLAYGYACYAVPAAGGHALAWADAPGWSTDQPGSILGGTGLAVAARTAPAGAEIRAWTRAFLAPDVQSGLVPEHAGQPADRAVWAPGPVDDEAGHYYTATARSLAHARIRPRHRGWIPVQDAASEIVRECVTGGLDPAKAVAEINRRYADSKRPA